MLTVFASMESPRTSTRRLRACHLMRPAIQHICATHPVGTGIRIPSGKQKLSITHDAIVGCVIAVASLCFGQSAFAQCQYNAQQLAQLQQQAAVYQQYINSGYCRDARLASACSQMRQFIQNVERITANCRNRPSIPTPVPPSNPNNCDALRRQSRANADASYRNAMNALARTRPGRQGGYTIVYQELGTIYCHERLWYRSPKSTFVSAWEAQRRITSITNNSGIVTGLSPR
jgi:hypothetical protein